MSKVIINKKYLHSKTKKDLIIALLLFVTGVILQVIISDYGKNPSIYVLVPLIIFMLPGVYFLHAFRKEQKAIKKDNATLKDLSMLPQKYTVMQNVYLPYNNTVIECHFLVVGENGVFVIESNGKRGSIYESKDSRYWLVYKLSKKSRFFVRPLENQKNIVDAKVIALAQYLKKFNIHTWIQGLSYFPDKKTEVHVVNAKCVFDNAKDLNDYIVNFPTKVEVDDLKKEKIEKLLSLDTLKI